MWSQFLLKRLIFETQVPIPNSVEFLLYNFIIMTAVAPVNYNCFFIAPLQIPSSNNSRFLISVRQVVTPQFSLDCSRNRKFPIPIPNLWYNWYMRLH